MAEKNKVTVRIAGNEYVICGTETPEYMQKVALFVDRKLLEISRSNHLLSTSMASVLAALNMADELFKSEEELDKTLAELDQIKIKYQELKTEFQRLKSDNERLRNNETRLHIELSKREAELKEVRNTIKAMSASTKQNG